MCVVDSYGQVRPKRRRAKLDGRGRGRPLEERRGRMRRRRGGDSGPARLANIQTSWLGFCVGERGGPFCLVGGKDDEVLAMQTLRKEELLEKNPRRHWGE